MGAATGFGVSAVTPPKFQVQVSNAMGLTMAATVVAQPIAEAARRAVFGLP